MQENEKTTNEKTTNQKRVLPPRKATDGDRELLYYRTSPDNKDFPLQGPQSKKQASWHRADPSIQMGTGTNIYSRPQPFSNPLS